MVCARLGFHCKVNGTSWRGTTGRSTVWARAAARDGISRQPHPLQFDGYLWCFGAEQADQVRGEHRGSGRGDAQPHGACLAASDAADRGLGGGDLVESDFRAGEQFGTCAGAFGWPGA
jgi:hypothetical protein